MGGGVCEGVCSRGVWEGGCGGVVGGGYRRCCVWEGRCVRGVWEACGRGSVGGGCMGGGGVCGLTCSWPRL